METVETIVQGIVIIAMYVYVAYILHNFITETPKQLRRIADALEKRAGNGR